MHANTTLPAVHLPRKPEATRDERHTRPKARVADQLGDKWRSVSAPEDFSAEVETSVEVFLGKCATRGFEGENEDSL